MFEERTRKSREHLHCSRAVRLGWGTSMSRMWGIWAILLLCSTVTTVHAQFSQEPVPEALTPPRAPEKKTRDRSPAAKLDKIESSLPAENAILFEGDANNAFCTDDCDDEDDPFHCWVKGELLYWMFGAQNIATPLVTTVSPQSAINLSNNFGAISQPNTVILVGPGPLETGVIGGGKVTIGAVPFELFPAEMSGFWLNRNQRVFSAQTSGLQGSNLFARPILQTNVVNAQGIPQEGVVLVGGPDQSNSAPGFGGAIDIDVRSNMWGFETATYVPIGASDSLFFDVILGYRHTELNESLEITNYLSSVNPAFVIPFNGDPLGFPPGFTTVAYDNFSTDNKFNGLQFGARTVLGMRRLGLIFDAKVALGATNMNLNIYGNSSLIGPNAALRGITTVPGGVLALPSNSGEQSVTQFTYMPELAAHFVLKLTRNIRLTATYSAMYWSTVVRPGNHVDSIVDTREIPTSFSFVPNFVGTNPARRFVETDFFAHGLAVGLWIGF